MSRKRSGLLDDLMEISAQLPWYVGIVLALAAYLVFHHFASQPPLTVNPAELKTMGKTMGDSVTHSLWTGLASILQYVVPLAFLIGAGVSAVRTKRGKDLPPSEIPACPKCGSAMVRRTARSGAKAGNAFWGCSQYPACRGIRN